MNSVPVWKWDMLVEHLRKRPGMYLTRDNELSGVPDWVADEVREELRVMAVERCPGRSL